MRLRDYSHQVDAGDQAVQFNPLLSITWDEEGEGATIPSEGPQMTTCNLLLQLCNFSRTREIQILCRIFI